MKELEALRSQYQILEQRLSGETIINDQLIHNSVRKHISQVQREWLKLALVPMLFLCLLFVITTFIFDDPIHEIFSSELTPIFVFAILIVILQFVWGIVVILRGFNQIIRKGGSLMQIGRHARFIYNHFYGKTAKLFTLFYFLVLPLLLPLGKYLVDPMHWNVATTIRALTSLLVGFVTAYWYHLYWERHLRRPNHTSRLFKAATDNNPFKQQLIDIIEETQNIEHHE